MRWRNKNVQYDLPSGVVEEVKAICKDHDRKRKSLIYGIDNEAVRSTYERYNAAVNDALLSIEEGARLIILEDIINERGYNKSSAALMMAQGGYYQRKRKLIYGIASNLHLV